MALNDDLNTQSLTLDRVTLQTTTLPKYGFLLEWNYLESCSFTILACSVGKYQTPYAQVHGNRQKSTVIIHLATVVAVSCMACCFDYMQISDLPELEEKLAPLHRNISLLLKHSSPTLV